MGQSHGIVFVIYSDILYFQTSESQEGCIDVINVQTDVNVIFCTDPCRFDYMYRHILKYCIQFFVSLNDRTKTTLGDLPATLYTVCCEFIQAGCHCARRETYTKMIIILNL